MAVAKETHESNSKTNNSEDKHKKKITERIQRERGEDRVRRRQSEEKKTE
jgi:hypothetical protein